jgi:hypothetical protein
MEVTQPYRSKSSRMLSPSATRWIRDGCSAAKRPPVKQNALSTQHNRQKKKGDLFMTGKLPSIKRPHLTFPSYPRKKKKKINSMPPF